MINKVITLKGLQDKQYDDSGLSEISFNEKLEVYLDFGWEMKSNIQFTKLEKKTAYHHKIDCMVVLHNIFSNNEHYEHSEKDLSKLLEIKKQRSQELYEAYKESYINYHKKDRTK